MHGCPGWSAPLFFACLITRKSYLAAFDQGTDQPAYPRSITHSPERNYIIA